MQKIKTFEIGLAMDSVRAALEQRRLPEALIAPMQALVADIETRAKQSPVAIYLCSEEEQSDDRNYFATLLARVLQRSVPSAVVVDCDFIAPGMGGIVPQRDALGFLDLLLYGSSLDAIRQQTRFGTYVISAGSFPVGKRSPVVEEVFEATKRYLASHSRCVIYVGPVLDDEELVHTFAEHVDFPILFTVGRRGRAGRLDATEEKVARDVPAVWSVRVAIDPRAPIIAPRGLDDEIDEIIPLEDIADPLPPAPGATPEAPHATPAVAGKEAPRQDEPAGPVAGVTPGAAAPRATGDESRTEATEPPSGETGAATEEWAGEERAAEEKSSLWGRPAGPPASADDAAASTRARDAATPRGAADTAGRAPAAAGVGAAKSGERSTRVPIDLGPRKPGSSTLPKVLMGIIAVVFVGFLVWWAYLTKSHRDRVSGEPSPRPQVVQPSATDSAAAPAAASEGGDIAVTAPGGDAAADASQPDSPSSDAMPLTPAGDAPAQTPAPPPAREPVTTASGGDDVDLGDSVESAIVVTDDLSPYSGQFGLHVSSFRSLDDARSDAYYLNDHGYPIIVASVDLGSKGKWFRVYVGPYTDRDVAETNKIRLDEMPRVKFTRITKL